MIFAATGARNYDPNIGRWFTPDRFVEKYGSFSPYSYAANNPIRYVDINGDSIYIAANYVEQFNKALSDVFGDNSSNVSYSESRMLSYSGDANDINHNSFFVINAVTDTYYNEPINPAGPARFVKETVSTNAADIVFYELGHIVHQGKTEDKVLDFNNVVRKQIGLKNDLMMKLIIIKCNDRY